MKGVSFFLKLFGLLSFSMTVWSADIILPMGPLDEITVKQVPAYSIVLRKECFFNQLDETYLKLTRYAVGQGFDILKPFILELPNLNWNPKQSLALAIPLPTQKQEDWPKDAQLFLENRESGRVLSIAFQGAYEFETIEPRLKQLRDWMKNKGLVEAGKPKLLLYHYRSFRLNS